MQISSHKFSWLVWKICISTPQQIKLYETSWQYPLISYIVQKAGSDLNEMDNENNTPILLAALNGHYPIVKYLYDNGVGYHATIPNTEPDLLYTDDLRVQ